MLDSNGNSQARLRKLSVLDDSPVLGRVNRSYSGSSLGSVIEKERRTSQFLDLPPLMK